MREIARKEEDQQVEAQFDGVVTVYEGRREFKALERAARRGDIPKRRVREYLPYRMLEVEVELMRAFLEPEVFEGSVRLDRRPQRPEVSAQTTLLGN